jgi:thymidine kinase
VHAIASGGRIEVITGSMFSGKTEELLRRLRRAEIAGQDVAVFTPAIDGRYGEDTVGSHEGRQWDAHAVPNDGETVWEIDDHLNGEEVVAVDEANFFDRTLIDVCEGLAADGRRVIVSGIDQTYRGEPFEPVPSLVALADYVEKLRAICAVCGNPATKNQRFVDGDPAHEDDPTIVVGAEESYEPRCRHCHTVRSG